MSVFRFGQLKADVRLSDKLPGKPPLDLYTVRISDPEESAWIESRIRVKRVDRTPATDFDMAWGVIGGYAEALRDPERWKATMARAGQSPEETEAMIQAASRLEPYLVDAMVDIQSKLRMYDEYRRITHGPLEMGIARVLQLPEHIGLKEEIADFFAYLYLVDKTSFHPDEDFESYVTRDGKRAYSNDEAQLRNALMFEAFQAADFEEIDIYELALWVGALTGVNVDPDNEATAPAWLRQLAKTWA